jgi:4-aminobutyrate aminotransferase
MEDLIKEGDVNFSSLRSSWRNSLSDNIRNLLEEDDNLFLHQSLSTPCLSVIESSEGIYFTDADGKGYMDFHGNAVHQSGYGNRYIMDKVKQQMDVLTFSPRRYTNSAAVHFAKKLTGLLPAALSRVLFAPGGTSVIGIALKLARVVTGKSKVVSINDSFHGASLDAIGAGGEEQFKKYMGSSVYDSVINISQPETFRNPLPDDVHYADELERVLQKDNSVGAFIAETIRNTDIQIPSRAYWQRIRQICTEYNILLILDEIPIAFGRTGKMFAFEHYDIIPDVLCLGKGLGAGIIPFAAMITKDDYNVAADVSLGHFTHEKSPLGSAAASAMIDWMQHENILQKVQQDEKFFKNILLELQQKHQFIGDIRGVGLLWGLELVKDRNTKEPAFKEAEHVMYKCLEMGLSFKVSKGNVLQLCPPLIITKEQLTEACAILDTAFSSLQ